MSNTKPEVISKARELRAIIESAKDDIEKEMVFDALDASFDYLVNNKENGDARDKYVKNKNILKRFMLGLGF